MEKIDKGIEKKFPLVKLYLEDIKEIVSFVEESLKKDVQIKTDNYKFGKKDLTEEKLKKLKNKEQIKNISVEDYRLGDFIINFDRFWGENKIYSRKNSVTNVGIVEGVFKIVNKRKVLFRHVNLKIIAAILSFILFLLSISVFSFGLVRWNLFNRFNVFALVSVILGFIFVFISSRLDDHTKNIFIYKTRDNAPSFLERNKDTLIVNTIITLIGVGVGSLLTYLLMNK